jgi:hypothetical protein
MTAAPGDEMEYEDRGATPGDHSYAVHACVGEQVSAPAEGSVSVPTRRDYVDHDNGNALLTVTDAGTCGFYTAGTSEGSGFVYPLGGSNNLWIGSLWAGADSLYALNRDYADDPYGDWLFWDDLEGPTTEVSDQDYRAVYDDGGHAYPRGLSVQQDSWSWSTAPYDDFVIVRYTLTNTGSEPINDLYVGQFMDWDIGTDPWHNQGGTDSQSRMAYMWHATGLPYAGVALLDTLPDDPPLANLSLIHNPTYVYPHAYLLDSDRIGFLKRIDPAHSVHQSAAPDDWGAIVSAGPTTSPAVVARLAFAVIGGTISTDLLANAARLGSTASQAAGLPMGWTIRPAFGSCPAGLNPPAQARRSVPTRRRAVRVCVCEASGRLVRSLVDQIQLPGQHVVFWDGRDDDNRLLPSGVYFYRLAMAGGKDTRQMVLIR